MADGSLATRVLKWRQIMSSISDVRFAEMKLREIMEELRNADASATLAAVIANVVVLSLTLLIVVRFYMKYRD